MSPGVAPDRVLRLPEFADVADLETLLGRARSADPEGAVRLQASGSVLAITVCLVPGAGLLASGLVLGLRAARLAQPATADVVVGVEAVGDRLARMRREQSTDLSLPPVEVRVPWSAVAPPRTGWEPRGVVDLDDLRRCARDGIEEIAQGAPQGSGAAAVADLRRRVWGRAMGLPAVSPEHVDEAAPVARPVAGLAFGAYALGFLSGGPATWHTCGAWQRLSTPVGHVLAR